LVSISVVGDVWIDWGVKVMPSTEPNFGVQCFNRAVEELCDVLLVVLQLRLVVILVSVGVSKHEFERYRHH
jgi:hypothetical protein